MESTRLDGEEKGNNECFCTMLMQLADSHENKDQLLEETISVRESFLE